MKRSCFEYIEKKEEEEHNWVFSADQTGLEMSLGMNTLMGYGYSLIHPGGDEVDPEWDSSQTTIGHVDGNSDLAHSVLEVFLYFIILILHTLFNMMLRSSY
ncbi:hypothetical protein HanPSC8_Chr14g0605851 [Helianthus annuus]|nr:hypothetical protein HanPSC8_Chr14g0605851 [Helianthus annuus]